MTRDEVTREIAAPLALALREDIRTILKASKENGGREIRLEFGALEVVAKNGELL